VPHPIFQADEDLRKWLFHPFYPQKKDGIVHRKIIVFGSMHIWCPVIEAWVDGMGRK